jgi:hypothetical protein
MYKVLMARRFLILLFISCFTALRCLSQVITSDDRLRQIVLQYGQVEVTLPYSDKKSIEILTTNVSILSVIDNVIHVSLSKLTVEWFILQKYDYKIVERVSSKALSSAGSVNQAMDWDLYPTYLQYDSIMRSFSIHYPSLCRLDTIGTSVNGKLVLALKVTSDAAVNTDKPKVFYTSTMHGDETGGFILMLHLADYLLKNYNLDNRVTNLLDNLEIWINPLANPDGTYVSDNLSTPPARYNANGYDLNRNFPDPFTPDIVQQKETHDMIKFMRKHKFVLSANFHSGTEVVNYPWDRWLSKFHADDSWFNSISRAYADTAHKYAGPEYMNFLDNGVTRGAVWYVVYGGRQDFMTWELHGREVTIEVDEQYVTPAPQLALLWQNNWHSLLGYLENALYGIHGLVRDVNTHAPVPAKVFISGHDIDSSQVYSDTLTGSFVRFLYPGSWNLSFSATGYKDTTISNVEVVSGQKTDLIVDMSPGVSGIEKTKSGSLILLYPNPARDYFTAQLPDMMAGKINIRIINPVGMLMSEYSSEVVQGIPFVVGIRSLSAGTYIVIFTNTVTGSFSYGRFVIIK